ncbi:redox-sensing transcriptional repressor Rex [Desulfatiglans anilini]|uniref:redox-sensing transcriptional repressor Rex n=1 Tax=Desulfatiglans anilini TaxID=90728 RepID=UPI001ABF7C11|nr:redox-sensing transcriptional repressor Rex [Desulfatiglans anilini]
MPMIKESKIPQPTIERLALYSRPLEGLGDGASQVISSERLAALCGVNSAQVRKDLAYFGEFGIRGVGYDVKDLLKAIKKILATDRVWKLCIVGMSYLGTALVENENFRRRGYHFVAAFDPDQRRVGKVLPCGLVVEPMRSIKKLVRELGIEIGVITTRPEEAKRSADLLMKAGVRALLNFTPVRLRIPECCLIENVDITVKLENLAYHLSKNKP